MCIKSSSSFLNGPWPFIFVLLACLAVASTIGTDEDGRACIPCWADECGAECLVRHGG